MYQKTLSTLPRRWADNSLIEDWEPQHCIQFYHSKADIIVNYGNYLTFQGAHPQSLGDNIYRIDNTFSDSDHTDAGTTFLLNLLVGKSYADVFNWICEESPTGIASIKVTESQMSNAWYTLDGRRLSGTPKQKGIYIYIKRRRLSSSKYKEPQTEPLKERKKEIR